MQKYWFPLVMALSFCALLSTCFIESVFAPGGDSPDHSCYAYVEGELAGYYFGEEFHQGGYFRGNIYHTPYTIFRAYGPQPYYHYIALGPTKMYAYAYYYNAVAKIVTVTDSGFSVGLEDYIWYEITIP